MPTPESAAFLAKKPTVPPTFDGVDYDDQRALKAAQDAIIREQWVKTMMARLVRDELGKCYYTHGVNHLEKCGSLRGMFASSRVRLRWWEGGWRRNCVGKTELTLTTERYLELLRESKIKGFRFEMQNYVPKEGRREG
jgi:hypothetical protein